ncbi:prolyl oligopeptidase family serine peptidase [Persicirhabdus sediminis]|uniref:Prolyl oligopeptidase family serine peptidase n=2 Tax=Persicirhabdus sediminis TaxID=454144 RepID=A0A8J7MAY2_9BACT|nr:prolyl oligopeptidase family serine peptidase [Persicirhabdus sediminis]
MAMICWLASWSISSAQPVKAEVKTIDPVRMEKIEFLNHQYLLLGDGQPNKPAGKKPALIIYLHGAGGRGEDINKITSQITTLHSHVKKYNKGPCLIVAPQVRKITNHGENATWTAADLEEFLIEVKKNHQLDESRIYLTGNSMGGYGSWMWAASHPEHFAAVAPVSGGIGRSGPKDITPHLSQWGENLAKLPVYAFAGGNDRVVPADRSQSVIEAIVKAGGNQAKLKIFPDEGHNVRRLVYSSAEFYDWLFAQRK